MNTQITPAMSTEAPDATGLYTIWPGDGRAPGTEGWTWQEKTMQVPWTETPRRFTRNVVVPTLTMFTPAPGTANGTAMIVAPGGAFHFLLVDHEGYDMARWLAARGITAFVLKYRLARSPDDDAELLTFRNDLQRQLAERRNGGSTPSHPLIDEARLWGEEDGRQAIRFVRANAQQWGIDPDRIGIGGFSAGGAVTLGPVFEHDAESRPAFAAPIYAAYRPGLPVPANAPPLFIVISDDDQSIPAASSARLYAMWHEAGIPAELHIFGDGAHGYGMAREGFLSDIWIELFERWMKKRGLMA